MAMAAAAPATADEFLELRERLKQDIRKKSLKQTQQQQKNNSGLSLPLSATATAAATATTTAVQLWEYGSFFGPSLSSVSTRVIEECKGLLQNPNSYKAKKVRVPPSKSKTEVIKESRDYSFLSSDETPTPTPASVKSVSSWNKPAVESEKQEKVVIKNEKVKTKAHELKKNQGPTKLASKNQVVGKNLNWPAQPSGPKIVATSSTKGKPIPKARPAEKLGQTAMVKARPKKRQLEECDNVDPERISKIIRGMYGYNPQKYGRDDHDDRNMEANFRDIEKEERRSAKLAKKEDDEELQKIVEEEKRESMKKKNLRK